jgi:hypothetical protein
MTEKHPAWRREGSAFWRAHEAWKRSDLNQRQYCEAERIPLKAFGNWRAQFEAEHNRPSAGCSTAAGPLSPPLSPPVSPPLGPGALSLFAIGRPHCSAASRGASTPVQRWRQTVDPPRGSATRCECRGGGPPVQHRPTHSCSTARERDLFSSSI